MAANQFVPWATGGGAFVLNNAAYQALAARSTGYPPGLAPKEWINSAVRQGSFVAAAVSQFLADFQPLAVNDDGVIANYENRLRVALRNQAASDSYLVDTGVADAYVVAFTPAQTAYANGQVVRFLAAHGNTDAATLNAGAGAAPLLRNNGQPLSLADIPAGGFVTAIFDTGAASFYLDSITVNQAATGAKTRYISTTTSLSVGAPYMVNTSGAAFVGTLPPAPTTGDTLTFIDAAATWDFKNFTLARNGQTIEGFASDLDCNAIDAQFSIWFNGATWKLI